MRTRIALVAASSVTFIGSTISLTAIHTPLAAAATKVRGTTAGHTRSASARQARSFTRLHGALHRSLVTAATLRTAEVSGTEVVGTYAPLTPSAGSTSTRRSGHRRSRATTPKDPTGTPVPAPVTAGASSTPATPAPAAPAPTTAPTPPATSGTRASTPSPAPASLADAPAAPTDWTSTDTPDWQCIRIEESGDAYNDPSRPSGAYGILDSTWLSLGYSGWPYEASATVQDAAALTLYHEYGWQPWSSRFACGL